MENHLQSFLEYFEKIRARTYRVIRCIPPDRLDWAYLEGKFTLGDLVRHLGAIERYMYAENARFQPNRYPGHGRDLAGSYDEVLAFFDRMHRESMAIFRGLTEEDMIKRCTTPEGASIPLWKWLRAMVEHEIHHRGQLYLYLAMLGVQTPPLFGLSSEEVRARSLKTPSAEKQQEAHQAGQIS